MKYITVNKDTWTLLKQSGAIWHDVKDSSSAWPLLELVEVHYNLIHTIKCRVTQIQPTPYGYIYRLVTQDKKETS